MVTGRAPSSLPFRGSCPESTCGQSRMQNYHKRPENIGDNARGQGAMAWVDPTGYPTETQQKRTCLRIPAQSRIFISYRREDSIEHTGRLYDLLAKHFGKAHVFMDIDTIGPGEDFLEVIEKTCDS